jgi:glucose/arabinose dehydrogenase
MKRVLVWAAVAAATVAGGIAASTGAARGALATTSEQHAWSAHVVATGFDSPRALTFLPNGKLLVSEAGHGGDVCVPAGPLGQECVGTTSAIASVDTSTGAVSPLVSGLFSQSITLEGITGADGLSAAHGKVVASIAEAPQQLANLSCDGQPADCNDVLSAARAQAGQLIHVDEGGTWQPLAGVGSHDYGALAADPALRIPGDDEYSNPYGVLAGARGTWVADAGANLVDFVPDDGSIQVASRLPNPSAGGFPADAVPTCVAVLRGNLYVADLAGRLWKRDGDYTPTEVALTGADGKPLLHHVTGCVSDGLDHLYLVDMWGTPGPPIPAGPQSAAGTGSVVEVTRSGAATVLATGLDFPNGIALAKDGSLYVTVGSTCTAKGTPFPYCANGGAIVHLTSS